MLGIGLVPLSLIQICEDPMSHSEKSCFNLIQKVGIELAGIEGCATFFEAAVKKKDLYHDKRNGQKFVLRQFKDFKSNKFNNQLYRT